MLALSVLSFSTLYMQIIMILLHANYDGFFYSRGLGAWLRTTQNGRFYGHNLQFTGGGEFCTWETTNYNLVQKLGKIQNWEYGPRVISLFGGAPCVHSRRLPGFAFVKKITALPSPGGGGNA